MKKLLSDEPIDEIRESRHRISARVGHDPGRLVSYYMKLQQQYGDRLIDAPKCTDDKDETAA